MNTNHYELTNTIPVPNGRKGRRSKYPFVVMKPGDSFFAPGVKVSALYQTAKNNGNRLGAKFVVRPTIEGGVAGVRAWRVK